MQGGAREDRESRREFRDKYRGFGHCVRIKAEAAEKRAARSAAKECKAERADPDFADTHDGKSFEEFYGNGNKRNAFGKCVSAKAREKLDDEPGATGQDVEPAIEDAATGATRQRAGQAVRRRAPSRSEAFEERYGTNHNGRNAFGKCVSSKARDGEESDT